jgi:hypothetical protein
MANACTGPDGISGSLYAMKLGGFISGCDRIGFLLTKSGSDGGPVEALWHPAMQLTDQERTIAMIANCMRIIESRQLTKRIL